MVSQRVQTFFFSGRRSYFMPVTGWVFVIIFLSGGLGALARWGVQSWLANPSSSLPWSTLVVNAVGSAVIGFLYYHQSVSGKLPSLISLAIMVGFLGALTTFSSFSLDTLKLLQSGSYGLAAIHVIGNNLVCLCLCTLGYFVAHSAS